jgi:hypothetical protein
MSQSMETLQTLDNMFKEQYLKNGLQRVLPSMAFLCSSIPFVSSEEQAGKELVWPVHLSYVHGFTAHGANGESLSLRKGTIAKTAQARVQPYAYTGRTQISNIAISRATGGAQAFVDAVGYHVENLQESFALMVEQELLYGQKGLGKCASGAFADSIQGGIQFADAVGPQDAEDGSYPILLSKQEWAEHVWIGADGMPVELYVSETASSPVLVTEVVKVDTVARIVWLADQPPADSQNHVLFRSGYKEGSGPGLQKILTHQTGSLFGINSNKHKLWRATEHVVNDNLSFEAVAAGIAKAQGRGLDSKLTLHINNRVFAEMMPDFNTLKQTGNTRFASRMFTESKDVERLEHGMIGLKFIVGSTELVVASNPLVKGGYGFGIPDGYFKRTGSTDITYDLPGQDGKYFSKLEDIAAVELRVFTDQALFAEALNTAVVFTGINIDD